MTALTRWLKASPAKAARARRLGVEALEGRDVPAIVTDVTFTGTAGGETLFLFTSGSTLYASTADNYTPALAFASYDLAPAAEITINMLGGNDVVEARQVAAGYDVRIDAGEGNDTIHGSKGNDFIICGDGDDIAYAHQGNDTVIGGHGNDLIDGEEGRDLMFGGGRVDGVYQYHMHATAVDAGTGLAAGTDGVSPNVDVLSRSDDLENSGNDNVYGGDGRDEVYGGDGNDKLWGGFDYFSDDGDADWVYGGIGDDKLWGGAGNDYLSGDDTDTSPDGNDSLTGGNGNDYMYGRGGNDSLNGGAGNDAAIGGAGYDVSTGGNEYTFGVEVVY